jgi:DHA1 family solute carrier family 18 vesicular amine transporter 1/2
LRHSRTTAVVLVSVATFTDIVAYSIAVPVLPDLSRRFGASPTTIGLLFASFGVTLLGASLPMGAVSDRIGRKPPLVGGLLALAGASALFAYAGSLSWLFAARLVQGAADAVTWVVGFALLADLYGPSERGRVTGIVMGSASFAFMVGPSMGGWLYEMGGMRLPFLTVAALALVDACALGWLAIPARHAAHEPIRLRALLSVPTVAACTACVIVISATLSMFEPVLAMYLQTQLGIGPARVGVLFGTAAVATMLLNPIYGRLADRWGARRMTVAGLGVTTAAVLAMSRASSFESALWLWLFTAAAAALVITPSLAYMAEATAQAGFDSFGVSYGLYNFAWGVGLLGGPAVGGRLFDLMGFGPVALAWVPLLVFVSVVFARVQSSVPNVRLAGVAGSRSAK